MIFEFQFGAELQSKNVHRNAKKMHYKKGLYFFFLASLAHLHQFDRRLCVKFF
jgi:hypothetical protein